MQDDRNEADRILGEDWMDPRHVLLQKALETHEQRELIRERQQETDASGQRICSGARSRRTAGSRSGCARGRSTVRRAASNQGRVMAGEGGRA
jgi:hypothetical protein